MQTKKRGRPAKPVESHARFKSISVPEEMYVELDQQAQALGISVGKLAANRIRNGHYDAEDERKENPQHHWKDKWQDQHATQDDDGTEDFV